ncbi:MAG TPA: lytic transglycosylase domain-containing protein [Acidimicrobiia bacterium]|nr:lytic transglycosylase domain-containing protein [Acidimicrobiia bacterium]
MSFKVTDLSFPGRAPAWIEPGRAVAWDGAATPGAVGRPGDLPVPARQQLRRWTALLVLAALALPGAGAAEASDRRPAGAGAAAPTAPAAAPGVLPNGDAGAGAPAPAAPWEAGLVEADGKPLPTAPPPGPVPVDGTPQPAAAAGSKTPPPTPAPSPAPGETARAVPNQDAAADDLVPADREYLRPILIRYAEENGLPADLVMAMAWVESSWRPSVVSSVGATGVMQLMPDTVDFVSKRLLGLSRDLDPKNATSNIRMGTKFFRHLLDQNHGNVRQALIAYNQGITSLMAQGSYAAADAYADRVLALRSQFRTA